jgi:hypothetical protein
MTRQSSLFDFEQETPVEIIERVQERKHCESDTTSERLRIEFHECSPQVTD